MNETSKVLSNDVVGGDGQTVARVLVKRRILQSVEHANIDNTKKACEDTHLAVYELVIERQVSIIDPANVNARGSLAFVNSDKRVLKRRALVEHTARVHHFQHKLS